MEISAGSLAASTPSMPMTTDVSTIPLDEGTSPARGRVLIDVTVDISSKFLVVNMRGALECVEKGLLWHELTSPDGMQFTHRPAVAGHDEVFSPIQRPHYLAAVVAQFSLGQFPGHSNQRSTCAPLKFGFAKGFPEGGSANHRARPRRGCRTEHGGPPPRRAAALAPGSAGRARAALSPRAPSAHDRE